MYQASDGNPAPLSGSLNCSLLSRLPSPANEPLSLLSLTDDCFASVLENVSAPELLVLGAVCRHSIGTPRRHTAQPPPLPPTMILPLLQGTSARLSTTARTGKAPSGAALNPWPASSSEGRCRCRPCASCPPAEEGAPAGGCTTAASGGRGWSRAGTGGCCSAFTGECTTRQSTC